MDGNQKIGAAAVRDYIKDRSSKDMPMDFEPNIPGLAFLYICDNKLIWEDEEKHESALAVRSLYRYVQDAISASLSPTNDSRRIKRKTRQ